MAEKTMYEARVLQAADFLRSGSRGEIICLVRPKVGEMAAVRGRERENRQTHASPLIPVSGAVTQVIEQKTQG